MIVVESEKENIFKHKVIDNKLFYFNSLQIFSNINTISKEEKVQNSVHMYSFYERLI